MMDWDDREEICNIASRIAEFTNNMKENRIGAEQAAQMKVLRMLLKLMNAKLDIIELDYEGIR